MTGLSGRHDLARSPRAVRLGSAGRGKHGAAHEVARRRCRRHLHRPRSLRTKSAARLIVDKVPSTPVDPSQGVHTGTARLDFDLADIAKLVHGTTVATTTIIERKGARTAVLTTAGFRDVLEDLQKAAGHRDPSTTKLYDRRGTTRKRRRRFLRRLNFRSRPAGTIPKGAENSRAIVKIYG